MLSSAIIVLRGSDAKGCIVANDTLREGKNRLIYRCDDIEGLSAAFQQVMLDESLRQRLSEGVQEIAAGQDAPNVAVRFVQALQRVFKLPAERSLNWFWGATRTLSNLGSGHGSISF